MKKILLIGNGAREHVIGETLKRSRHEVQLFVVGKTLNPGLKAICEDYLLANVCDKDAVKDFALKIKPDFAVIGPENPIAKGMVDMLAELEIKSASPLQTVGRLESSKSFTRDLLEKYKIPGNPKFKVFYDENGLSNFFDQLGREFVVKADGLKGGKGVMVSGDHLKNKEEGMAYAKECLKEVGRVIVEEKLIGQEFSLMSFCDGRHAEGMPVVQDHKRAYDGDRGPNTGGMGTYSDSNHSLPFLRAEDIEQAQSITRQVATALFKETGCYFKGIMYGGFMAVGGGIRLIEYNARFGDPEAMNVLPLLKTDFVEICEAVISGDLNGLGRIEFEKRATVCKYVVPNGYPDNPVKGEKIEIVGIPAAAHAPAPANIRAGAAFLKTYFASVDQRDDGLYLTSSRTVAFVGIADNLEEAERLAENGANSVKGPVFHRKDIGTSELIQKRVEMMNDLRA